MLTLMHEWNWLAENGTYVTSNLYLIANVHHREEIERQQKESHYRKMHEKGLTDEAQRDLARLALVRKHREEVAQKRQLEKKGMSKIYQI